VLQWNTVTEKLSVTDHVHDDKNFMIRLLYYKETY